jgi:predicted flap endonuclease-1-like 5' DNA nuclease
MAEKRHGAAGVKNDLAELKGIGPKYAEMLKRCGVDSIKELQHRTASHLKEMIEQRHGPVRGLSLDECQKWIDEAKAFYGHEAEAPKPDV